MKIYIVRHAETEANRLNILQGHEDIPLNSHGIKQAELLRDVFKTIDFDLVFSSDLSRAATTASIVSRRPLNQIVYRKELRELSFGSLEGSPIEIYHNNRGASFIEKWNYKPDRGENYPEKIIELRKFAENLKVLEKDNVLVVSHGATLRALLNHFLPLSIEELLKIKYRNTGYSILHRHSNMKFEVEHMESAPHLEECYSN